jgi:hypothetical protein
MIGHDPPPNGFVLKMGYLSIPNNLMVHHIIIFGGNGVYPGDGNGPFLSFFVLRHPILGFNSFDSIGGVEPQRDPSRWPIATCNTVYD